MRYFFTVLAILFFIVNVEAQKKVQITGTLMDEQTQDPLEYASVSLLNASDSSLVTGNVTDFKGSFTIQADPGNYILKMQFISYRTRHRRLNANEDLNLGIISLSPDVETLGEVVVAGQRAQMQLELDKRVFNVSEDLTNIGANASQILDNLPSIDVDVDGNVALRGSQNVRILINGRPSGLVGLSSTDALRQLQGNLIERIEVVTNPSARYEAEGSAGIINIILKKDRRSGFNGAFTLSTGYPHDHGISANANYRQKWFNLFLNYGFNYDERPGSGSSFQRFNYPERDTTYITRRTRESLRGGLSNTIRFGSEFFLNNKNTLTAAFLTRISDEDNNTDLIYHDISSDGNTVRLTQRSDSEVEDDDTYEYELSYRRTFDKEGQELTADFQYRSNNEMEESTIFEYDLLNEKNISNRQNSQNKQDNRNIRLQADYIHPIRKGVKFEAGYRGTIQDINSDFFVEEWNNGIWEELPDFTNEFNYEEHVHAAYAIFENKMDKWGYQLGMRLEQTDIEIFQRETNNKNHKSYLNAFPSAFLSYKISDENSVQASYSRRLSRPRFWYLNPFFSFSDLRNIRTGNMNLDPEYTDSYEIGFLNNREKTSTYFGAFYRHTTGVIDRISYDEQRDTITYTFSIPQNLSVENAYGLEMNFTFDPASWFSINGNANFYRAITEGSYTPEGSNNVINLDRDTYTASLRLNNKFKFGKYNLQLSGWYRAPQETTQGRRLAMYSVDLGANRDVLNNNGTLTLSVRDLFNTRKYQGITETANRYEESVFQWSSRQVNLSFTYRINQKKQRERGGRNGGDFEGGDDMGF
jgi:outer membrane receptor protein involved in Fe transport